MAHKLARVAAQLVRSSQACAHAQTATGIRLGFAAAERDLLGHLHPAQGFRVFHSSSCLLDSLNVQVPSMGDSISEGTIAAVLKQQGDAVEEDETIMQIETDKVTIDVRAPKAGKLEAVLVSAEDVVNPGQHVATVAAGEGSSAPAASGGSTAPQEKMASEQDAQLQGGISQPGSPHPGPQGGGVKQQKRQENLEQEQGASKDPTQKPTASHRHPSIKFPMRRTPDGRRLSSLPFQEAEQYRQEAQSHEGTASPLEQQEQPQRQADASKPGTAGQAQQSADDAAAERHMLYYRGRERGTKLSQSSVLSEREMDMIELGGAY